MAMFIAKGSSHMYWTKQCMVMFIAKEVVICNGENSGNYYSRGAED